MAFVLTAIIGGLIFAVLQITSCVKEAVHTVTNAPGKAVAAVVDKLAGAFKPQMTSTTIVSSGIGMLKANPKLVVLTTSIDCTIEKSLTTHLLWGYVYVGTTSVTVRARENQVQYFIPAKDIADNGNASFDSTTNTLTVCIPPPQLDEEMVSVQSDPKKLQTLTNGAWLSLDSREGKFVREQAMADLRPRIIAEGEKPILMERARSEAVKTVQVQLETSLAVVLQPGVRVRVQVKE